MRILWYKQVEGDTLTLRCVDGPVTRFFGTLATRAQSVTSPDEALSFVKELLGKDVALPWDTLSKYIVASWASVVSMMDTWALRGVKIQYSTPEDFAEFLKGAPKWGTEDSGAGAVELVEGVSGMTIYTCDPEHYVEFCKFNNLMNRIARDEVIPEDDPIWMDVKKGFTFSPYNTEPSHWVLEQFKCVAKSTMCKWKIELISHQGFVELVETDTHTLNELFLTAMASNSVFPEALTRLRGMYESILAKSSVGEEVHYDRMGEPVFNGGGTLDSDEVVQEVPTTN
jgi:hypothetical protein